MERGTTWQRNASQNRRKRETPARLVELLDENREGVVPMPLCLNQEMTDMYSA